MTTKTATPPPKLLLVIYIHIHKASPHKTYISLLRSLNSITHESSVHSAKKTKLYA